MHTYADIIRMTKLRVFMDWLICKTDVSAPSDAYVAALHSLCLIDAHTCLPQNICRVRVFTRLSNGADKCLIPWFEQQH